MNPAAPSPNHTLELSKSFQKDLEIYRDHWLNLPGGRHLKGSGDFEGARAQIFEAANLQKSAGQSSKVIRVESLFQLTNIPLVIALMMDGAAGEYLISTLRQLLNNKEWSRLWTVLDRELESQDLETLRQTCSKNQQKDTLKDINRFLRKLHENSGSTFDTTDSPKLSSLGLMVNSTMLAESRALSLSLEEELKAVVSPDCVEKVRSELISIPAAFERVETQIGLQFIPNILAESVRLIKEKLVTERSDLADELVTSLGAIPDLLKLIYQADLENKSTNLRAMELWGGARIGAYGDPAVRLIASTIQLDIFRRSQVLDWLPLHLYMRSSLPGLYSLENDQNLNAWEELIGASYAFVLYDGISFVCDPPKESMLDPERRYHSETGPALTFKDETRIFSWHGRNVPAFFIEEPDQINIERIDAERNIELRTILIDRYGISRFLEDSGARVIQQDQYGTLFQRTFRNDEPLLVVMVKNSTPEPDGTYKHYFLRVPPDTLTAKAGIAWTFGLNEAEYEPDIQT